MSLIDRCRHWLQTSRDSSTAGPAGDRSEDEEQRLSSSPGDDDDPSSETPNRFAEAGGGTGLFDVFASTCDDVRQAIAKGIQSKPWPGAPLHVGVATVVSLLVLLLLYQTGRLLSSPDAEIRVALQGTAYVSRPTFNCSELGLKGTKTVEESQHYHIFPSDPDPRSTCRSKFEQHCYRKNTQGKFLPPPKFLQLLRRYEEYHERCTNSHNLTALGKAGEAPTGCKYLVWKAMDGMGNQLLSLVCAFIYSLLTDRVLLVDTASHIDQYLCNPFAFSSWALPADFPEAQLRWQAMRVSTYLDETLAALNSSSCSTIPPADLPAFIDAAPKHLHALIICCDKRRDHQFFCPTAQKLFSGSNCFFYRSHEYTIPGLYFNPEFRDKLNDWFPRHDVFMHASRYLLSPESSLWERISQFYRTHMDGADRLVGIQPRSWKGDYDISISKQIARCAVEQKLLPATLQGKKTRNATIRPVSRQNRHVDISVLVTSLRSEYRDNLALEYANHPNIGNLVVDVIAASSEGQQRTGDSKHDATAIMEIWLLSFMDELVITPFSTFGSTASGFAGIVPLLFRNYGNDNLQEPACGRTNAGGPCFIVYPRDQPCDLDPARASIFDPNQKVPEVKFCDFNPGLGIVTT